MANASEQPLPGNLSESRQASIYTVIALFTILNTLAVILRFLSRRISRVSWLYDDTLMVAAWVVSTSFNLVVLADVRFGGVGLHETYLLKENPKALEYFSKILLAVAITYLIAVILPRLAVLSTYVTIFSHQQLLRTICYGTMGLLVANCIGSCIAGFVSCIPLTALWDKSIEGHCINLNAWYRWTRLTNVLGDLIILIIPLPHLVRLQNSIRLKAGLIFTFCLGSVGFVAAIVSWVEYFRTNAESDVTWSGVTVLNWGVIEVGMYLIAACLLCYQPLIKIVYSKLIKKPLTTFKSSQQTTPRVASNNKWVSKNHFSIWAKSNNGTRVRSVDKDEEDALGLVSIAQHHQRSRNSSQAGDMGGIMVEHEVRVHR